MSQPKSQEIFLKDNNTIAKQKLKFHLRGRNLKIVPALVGLTGIGKTAIVNQVAKELGYELIYFNMAQQTKVIMQFLFLKTWKKKMLISSTFYTINSKKYLITLIRNILFSPMSSLVHKYQLSQNG